MKEKRPFSLRRSLWKLICLVLGLTLALMLLLTAGFRYLAEQIRFSAPAETPTVPATVGETVLEFLDPSDVNWTQLTSDVKKSDRQTLNILLIGQDRRENDTVSRADSILLCSFRKDSGSLVMTSFLRDTYVRIPGKGKHKLNTAYPIGGMPLLDATLKENFGVTVDGNIEVDFSQFEGIIDLLGGVEIHLTAAEAAHLRHEDGFTL